MSQREQFLAWFKVRYPDEVPLTCDEAFDAGGDLFVNPRCAIAWAAWQAATPVGIPAYSLPTAMTTTTPVGGLRFTFGKYKGQLYEDILRANPGYFVWLMNGYPGHDVPAEFIERAQAATSKPTPGQASTYTAIARAPTTPPATNYRDDFADDDIPF